MQPNFPGKLCWVSFFLHGPETSSQVEKSIEHKNAKFMWRFINGFLPESLSNNLRSNQRTNYSNSISRLESLKRFIRFSGPKLWQELPHCITSKPSLKSFSNALKNYFIHGNMNTPNTRKTSNRQNNNRSNHASRLDNNRGLNQPFVSRWNT